MVDVSKKGNVEKGVALQKKGEAAKRQFWKKSDATPGRQSLCCRAALKLLLFHIRSHFTKISTCSQSSCHPGYLCFVILITWRTQDASWWPRWGWRARRRWCRHWCQRPSEGSHSATSAPGLASHISLQRRIGFSTAIVFGWGMITSTKYKYTGQTIDRLKWVFRCKVGFFIAALHHGWPAVLWCV